MPTTGEEGLEARLSPHFGSAPHFTFVDTESGEVAVLTNPHARHGHGECTPPDLLRTRGVDAVVCRGLGRRALAGLKGMGIEVLVTEAWRVARALEAFNDGAARPLLEEAACGGGHGSPNGRNA